MPALIGGGLRVEFSVDVRKSDGTLLYREASVMMPKLPEAPPEPTCFTVPCINHYKKLFDEWTEKCRRIMDFCEVLQEYHTARCAYCMEHRNDEIEEKYRTGVPSLRNIEEAKRELDKVRRLQRCVLKNRS